MTEKSLNMPRSLPSGMRLELSRAKLLPNTENKFSEWMDFLHENYSEIQAGLGEERAIFESTFVRNDKDGTRWIYHLSLMGETSKGLNTEIPLSAKHSEFARQCKERGWEELQPTLFLAPKEVIQSMSGWLQLQI